MTNYQKIKEMSVEELADFNIKPIIIEDDDYDDEDELTSITMIGFQTSDEKEFIDYDDAYEHELNWLKQECKE